MFKTRGLYDKHNFNNVGWTLIDYGLRIKILVNFRSNSVSPWIFRSGVVQFKKGYHKSKPDRSRTGQTVCRDGLRAELVERDWRG